MLRVLLRSPPGSVSVSTASRRAPSSRLSEPSRREPSRLRVLSTPFPVDALASVSAPRLSGLSGRYLDRDSSRFLSALVPGGVRGINGPPFVVTTDNIIRVF